MLLRLQPTAASVTLLCPMPRRPQPLRIAIDTGGTFTDCVWRERGNLRMLKVFSTPADPSQAIVEALKKIAPEGDVVLLHGTTVGTNTLLERKGARTALVTTAGFEDAIEIGRQARPKLYDFFFDRIEPLVPKDLRFGIDERTAGDGEILTKPTSEELRALAEQLAAAHPQSIAISLLFSFANPKNEQSIAEALKPLEVPLSISHQILPEFREYERTSTVVINAYLQPIMQSYLESLEAKTRTTSKPHVAAGASPAQARESTLGGESLGGADPSNENPNSASVGAKRFNPNLENDPSTAVRATVEERPFRAAKVPQKNRALAPVAPRIFVMQSSGGITALSTAAREPVRTVLSGPAGGVVGAATSARASGFDRIIAFDMGGTSTDVSLVEGEIKTATDAQIAGLPISVPMLDDPHRRRRREAPLARFERRRSPSSRSRIRWSRSRPHLLRTRPAAHRHRRQSSSWPPPAHALSRWRLHARSRSHPSCHARISQEAGKPPHTRPIRLRRRARRQRDHGKSYPRCLHRTRTRPAPLRASSVWRRWRSPRLRPGRSSQHSPHHRPRTPRRTVRLGNSRERRGERLFPHGSVAHFRQTSRR